MMNLWEVLKASKTGIAPDLYARLLSDKLILAGKIAELADVPPLYFKSDGEPLIDYTIYGNTVQPTTPTPQNPVMPEGTGERTENLFDRTAEYVAGQATYNYTISGLDPNKYYTCSTNFARISGVGTASVYFNGGNSINNGVWSGESKSFKPDSNGKMIVYVRYTTDAGAPPIYDDLMSGTIWIMVNEGSTALPYEPYGYKISISSASTTTPVYLGEVQTTRRIKKLVLTGEESTWTASGEAADVYYVSLVGDEYKGTAITTVCTHFKSVRNSTNYLHLHNGEMCLYNGATSSVHTAGFKYPNSSLSDFKAFLAQQYANGTPITVWYVLATPETGIVNEPLMKIGEYADTLSMEQAGVEIPTVRGDNTLDVLTDVKPTKVRIKYHAP